MSDGEIIPSQQIEREAEYIEIAERRIMACQTSQSHQPTH